MIDELAQLLDLYLAAQPRSFRRGATDVARALGWRLDRTLAADLVSTLSDGTVRLVVAELYDRAERLLAHRVDELAELDVDDPQLRAVAGAELRAALARASW